MNTAFIVKSEATKIRCTNCNLPASDHTKRDGWCIYPLMGWHSTKFAPPETPALPVDGRP